MPEKLLPHSAHSTRCGDVEGRGSASGWEEEDDENEEDDDDDDEEREEGSEWSEMEEE